MRQGNMWRGKDGDESVFYGRPANHMQYIVTVFHETLAIDCLTPIL